MLNFHDIFACHSENLDKIFNLRDCPYKFSEINVLIQIKVRNKYVKGAAIFNAKHQGGRKLCRVLKLQLRGSQGMKSIGCPRPGYENSIIYPRGHGVQNCWVWGTNFSGQI